MGKKYFQALLLVGVMFCLLFINGCSTMTTKKSSEKEGKTVTNKKDAKAKEDTEDKEDAIVAGSIDTASQYTFEVEESIIGINEAQPIVVLVGKFTNNANESTSFSRALEVTATQNGYTLKSEYIWGSSEFNYNDIAPGATISVIVGWKLIDGENDVTLKVNDSRHYANEEIYSKTFTIDTLIENTKNYKDTDEIFENPVIS